METAWDTVEAARIARHLKHQHWTAVFLDFVIVVLGVFIGLQASNRNSARHDRALERQYLQRLRNDLQLSLNNVDSDVSKLSAQARLEGRMVRELVTCRLDPAERARFASGLFLFGQFEPPPLVRGTIDELRSTGRLGLLRDVRLRQTLAKTLQLARINQGVLQMIIARATPDIVYLDRRIVITLPGDGLDSAAVRQGRIPAGTVNFDSGALCKDPRTAAAISAVQRMTDVVIIHNQTEASNHKALLKIIDHDLRRTR